MTDLRNIISARVRRAREDAKLTQEQAQEACGMNRGTWQALEYGKSWPQVDTLMKVAHGLKVPLGTLLGLQVQPTKPGELSPEMQAAVRIAAESAVDRALSILSIGSARAELLRITATLDDSELRPYLEDIRTYIAARDQGSLDPDKQGEES